MREIETTQCKGMSILTSMRQVPRINNEGYVTGGPHLGYQLVASSTHETGCDITLTS